MLMATSYEDLQDLVGRFRTPIPAGVDLSVTRFFDDISAARSERTCHTCAAWSTDPPRSS